VKELALSLLLLTLISYSGLPSAAFASQRTNDPERTLSGKALGTGGTGSASDMRIKKVPRKSRSQ
jgi:hypothetical protein